MDEVQREAMRELEDAKRQERAAFDIYARSPSGFLGGIARDCRKGVEEAHKSVRVAQAKACEAGCDIGLVYGSSPMGLTIDDARRMLHPDEYRFVEERMQEGRG